MKYDLYDQMSAKERAELLLSKYSFEYIKEVVNGIIVQSRKLNETARCNYWNEVSLEIKKIKNL
jgi:hypothetical protein